MEGQTHISISRDQFQAALGKVNTEIGDLEGLRLYAAVAVIESPGGWLPSADTSTLALEDVRGQLKDTNDTISLLLLSSLPVH